MMLFSSFKKELSFRQASTLAPRPREWRNLDYWAWLLD